MVDKMKQDPAKVQMTLLNDYLNAYTEKLARATLDDPSNIKIDGTDFYQIVKDVNADSYNPYVESKELKDEISQL